MVPIAESAGQSTLAAAARAAVAAAVWAATVGGLQLCQIRWLGLILSDSMCFLKTFEPLSERDVRRSMSWAKIATATSATAPTPGEDGSDEPAAMDERALSPGTWHQGGFDCAFPIYHSILTTLARRQHLWKRIRADRSPHVLHRRSRPWRRRATSSSSMLEL
jgi:hypothetical protein